MICIIHWMIKGIQLYIFYRVTWYGVFCLWWAWMAFWYKQNTKIHASYRVLQVSCYIQVWAKWKVIPGTCSTYANGHRFTNGDIPVDAKKIPTRKPTIVSISQTAWKHKLIRWWNPRVLYFIQNTRSTKIWELQNYHRRTADNTKFQNSTFQDFAVNI